MVNHTDIMPVHYSDSPVDNYVHLPTRHVILFVKSTVSLYFEWVGVPIDIIFMWLVEKNSHVWHA